VLRVLYLFVLVAALVGYYETFGPGPGRSELIEDLEWWRPWGFAERWDSLGELAEGGPPGSLIPLAAFALPPVALLAAGTLLFRGALMRALVWIAALTMGVFLYYGYQSPGVWRFFAWRFPSVALSFTAIVGLILFAPSLLRRILRVSLVLTALALALAFAGIFLLSTEITGTNPWMRFNISPWPVVSLFGLLLVGSWLAAVHGAAGVGSWLATRLGGMGGIALGTLAAAAVGGALSFAIFDSPGVVTGGLIVGVSAIYAIVCELTGPSDRAEAGRGALVRLGAGAFIFSAIWISNQAAMRYQVAARNETATAVLVALEEFKERNETYPDRLDELVPAYFDEVPHPRIGLILDESDEFTYSNFGDSYALEFASVQWVQCGYSPPFEFASYDEEEDEEEVYEDEEDLGPWDEQTPEVAAAPASEDELALRATLAEHGLAGSWNCATTPPKIW
jgi:hypothetical protein